MTKDVAEEKSSAKKYTKEQLIRSFRYARYRDLLGALLQNGKSYTFEEVEVLLNKYLKGKVK